MDYIFWVPILFSVIALLWNLLQQKTIENLKKQNQKENLIHKIQFEKEFNIYNELWGHLVDLRNFAGALRPQLDYADPNQSEEDRKTERLEKLNKTYQECYNTFEKNKPFYPIEVYNEIKNTIMITRTEVIEYQHGDLKNREYWDEAKKNIDKIVESMDKACEIIRTRIGLIRLKD